MKPAYSVVHLLLLLLLLLLLPIILVLFSTLSLAQHRCTEYGPEISFPFRLKDTQPQECAYPEGFDLLCTGTGETIFELPFLFPVKLVIENIDYEYHQIYISRVDGYDYDYDCLLQQLPILNLSASPFSFTDTYNYAIFTCSSSRTSSDWSFIPTTCLSKPAHFMIYAVDSFTPLYGITDLISCTKMYEISVPCGMVYENYNIVLNWTVPSRRLKSNSTAQDAVCYTKAPSDTLRKLKVAGEVFASFLVVLMLLAAYGIYKSMKKKKEDQVKIEKFLEDYKALKPARYSYADVKKITNRFSENLGEGSYGTVYKGKLSDDVFVAVKVLNNSKGDGEEFVNEVSTIGGIHHINVVRLVGYCADGFHRALVYEYLVNNSLEKFISSPNDKNFLG